MQYESENILLKLDSSVAYVYLNEDYTKAKSQNGLKKVALSVYIIDNFVPNNVFQLAKRIDPLYKKNLYGILPNYFDGCSVRILNNLLFLFNSFKHSLQIMYKLEREPFYIENVIHYKIIKVELPLKSDYLAKLNNQFSTYFSFNNDSKNISLVKQSQKSADSVLSRTEAIPAYFYFLLITNTLKNGWLFKLVVNSFADSSNMSIKQSNRQIYKRKYKEKFLLLSKIKIKVDPSEFEEKCNCNQIK